MMMKIRLTKKQDGPFILDIYAYARSFMIKTGNPGQWIDGYPSQEVLLEDQRGGNSYVCENESGKVVGTFCFKQGVEPNYLKIYNGEWLNDEVYGVIHRLASDGSLKGFADHCIAWCFERCLNLRVDTHVDNRIMRHILEKNGFVKCGMILVENGTPRIAFQKTVKSETNH